MRIDTDTGEVVVDGQVFRAGPVPAFVVDLACSGGLVPVGQGAARSRVDVIVRDAGESWQVVLQTDHADLSAQFAASWSDATPRPSRCRSRLGVTTTVGPCGTGAESRRRRHACELPRCRRPFAPCLLPRRDRRDHGAGRTRACSSPMHGAGIYRQRYGLDPGLALTRAPEVQDEVEAFVAEQEAKFGGDPGDTARLRAASALRPPLAVLLHRDVEAASRPTPGLCLEPVGPWHVRITPYPFAEAPAHFSLVRRVLPSSGHGDVLSKPPEHVADHARGLAGYPLPCPTRASGPVRSRPPSGLRTRAFPRARARWRPRDTDPILRVPRGRPARPRRAVARPKHTTDRGALQVGDPRVVVHAHRHVGSASDVAEMAAALAERQQERPPSHTYQIGVTCGQPSSR